MNHRVALVTGAARRIGAEIAKELHGNGYDVILHYRQSQNEAQALAAELNSQRADSCCCIAADFDDLSSINKLAEQAVAWGGQVDLLVNNASSFYETSLAMATTNDWDSLFNSNVKAAFFLVQALAQTLTQSQGCIINIVDIHGDKPLKKHSIYCMAKAALSMMTLSLAKELSPEVRVNGVSPGVILWPEQDELEGDVQQQILQRVALNRQGSVNEIAKTVLFLAKEASYITGQIIAVDGGRSLHM